MSKPDIRRLSRGPSILWIRDFYSFAIACSLLFTVGLFVPSVQIYKGTIRIGRLPVFLAYFGIFDTFHWPLALPVVGCHLLAVIFGAWLVTLGVQTIGDFRQPRRSVDE